MATKKTKGLGRGLDALLILEFMELQGRLIQRHRIYWGWFGTQTLIASALRKQAQAPSEH